MAFPKISPACCTTKPAVSSFTGAAAPGFGIIPMLSKMPFMPLSRLVVVAIGSGGLAWRTSRAAFISSSRNFINTICIESCPLLLPLSAANSFASASILAGLLCSMSAMSNRLVGVFRLELFRDVQKVAQFFSLRLSRRSADPLGLQNAQPLRGLEVGLGPGPVFIARVLKPVAQWELRRVAHVKNGFVPLPDPGLLPAVLRAIAYVKPIAPGTVELEDFLVVELFGELINRTGGSAGLPVGDWLASPQVTDQIIGPVILSGRIQPFRIRAGAKIPNHRHAGGP